MSDRMMQDVRRELLRFQFDFAAALLWLLCAPFYGLGWLAGFVVRCVLWAVAAIVAGYRSGMGQ